MRRASWMVVVLMAGLLGTSPAHAFELLFGGQLRAGGATISDGDISNEDQLPGTGFGGVGQVFVIFKPIPEAGVGLFLSGNVSAHSIDQSVFNTSDDVDVEATAGAFGLKLRGHFQNFGAHFQVGYSWGHIDYDIPTIIGTLDLDFRGDGYHIGMDVFYEFELIQDLSLEFGPYFTVGGYQDDNDEDTDHDTIYATFGIMVQGVFTLGL